MNISAIPIFLKVLMAPHGKLSYLKSLPERATLLDVGCGNNSPQLCKKVRPDVYYVGVDIGDYKQTVPPQMFANEYHIASPEDFTQTIAQLPQMFDGIISAHNIEHCNNPDGTLEAMISRLKKGGTLFMSFPSSKSVSFPRRTPTLNFFDDPTHQTLPDLDEIVGVLQSSQCSIQFLAEQYKPFLGVLRGLINEPLSFLSREVKGGTWALYGFETIIWATRK